MSEPTVTVIDNNQDNDEGINFAFGDATPVLANSISDYTGVFAHINGEYYNPPVDFTGLAKLLRANGHHESALFFKRNMMLKWLLPNRLISRRDFRYLTLDWQVFANIYLRKIYNSFGNLVRMERMPALNMRKRIDGGFSYLHSNNGIFDYHHETINYREDEIIHIAEADVVQNIYGIPQYLGGIQSVLLSESATLFRRSYFVNGNHAGYILATWDLPKKITDNLALKMQEGKGPGNFNNFFISTNTKNNGPGQKSDNVKDKIQVIPIGDLSQHDDYEKIKNVTLKEILNMHRIQPALAAMIPEAAGGFGDIEKISRINYENEVIPMQQILLEINDYLSPQHWVQFEEPDFKE